MAVDTLICGECKLSFNELDLFVEHKNTGCSSGVVEQKILVEGTDIVIEQAEGEQITEEQLQNEVFVKVAANDLQKNSGDQYEMYFQILNQELFFC